MRERLENGPVNVRIEIESSFYDGPNRTLVAEIPGAITPDERIVLAAHLQEPARMTTPAAPARFRRSPPRSWTARAGAASTARHGR